MGDLFEQFKSEIPEQRTLFQEACRSILNDKDAESIKESFSGLVEALHDEIYKRYLDAECDSGNKVINSIFCAEGPPSFESLDKFFMSVSQSRKPKAGKAFEWILEELLNRRLGFPMVGQVEIDGAKPDFLLPSKEYFEKNAIDCMLLTAKRTTFGNGWRQVVTEADKTYSFFLATLDPDISENQLKLAAGQKIFLVTTKSKIFDKAHYQNSGNVISFEEFITKHLEPAMKRWQGNY